MTNLLLVRHSEPDWGPDLPPSQWVLTDRGRDRAKLLGEYLATRAVSTVFTSDERKAVETAEIAAGVAGIGNPVVDQGFREHDRDNSPRPSGIPRDELVIKCIQSPDSLIWGNETVDAARQRFGSAISKAIPVDSPEVFAVVSHGTVITTFVADLLGIDPVPLWRSMGVPWLVEIDWPDPDRIIHQISFE